MYSVSDHSAAADRARWLAELSAALDEALALLPDLMIASRRRGELAELHASIGAACAKVTALREEVEQPIAEFSSDWRQLFGKCQTNAR